jgi:hypothetical protein
MLSFRQPGDMGRYVADNDPGGIAEGFSNLEDFLAAGNKIPEYMTNREPLQAVDAQQGPLATVSGPNDSLDLFAGRPVLSGDEERISGVGQDIFGNNPAEIPVPSAPQNNQFQGFDDRLTKIEEGIASLLQNRGQQSNFGMQPRFNFGMQPRFNTSGLGYFFRPDGGI